MKILMTGASSFTGCHFVRRLSDAGHTLTATFTRDRGSSYMDEPRRHRVAMASDAAIPVWGCRFGDEAFLELCRRERFDAICHHAAEVTDYKREDFDVPAALAANTRRAREVFEALAAGGCRRVVLTGSVFEGGEGAGSEGLPHFSPYGLSKSLSNQALRFHAERAGFHVDKFVVTNPFGPYEEPRFTSFLIKSWAKKQTPIVKTPAYVRDNIHVDLLAASYAAFVADPPEAPKASDAHVAPGFRRLTPSGYVETQGAFAERFAAAMRERLGLPCELELAKQTEFPEPKVRLGVDVPDADALGFDESAAWDELADYYRGHLHENPR